jgi:hypothetical protein
MGIFGAMAIVHFLVEGGGEFDKVFCLLAFLMAAINFAVFPLVQMLSSSV